MKTIEMIQNLGFFTVGTVSFFGTAAWVFKSVFTYWINSRSEGLKNDLMKLVESHKAELQKFNNEHQVRFSKLHQDQAITIKEIYKLLVKVELSMNNLFSPLIIEGEPPRIEKAKQAVGDINAFINYYFENRIYFNSIICEIIDGLIEQVKLLWYDYSTYEINFDDLRNNLEAAKESRAVLKECHRKMKEDIPLIKVELENHFRTLLGVS
ncbi:hypothetical protein LQV63_31395 [Paenibacillus profundus]|uniref:Uncharacterized protein n=1 Tax=Paenibacillus profundus TaxID=1173085 RepID=A0ABS8YTQ5_9BACL|nr:hypothetical protein [Paenibacillus profundus]MCE5173730.1 hypothetical protein [Paenibacillus profundus]